MKRAILAAVLAVIVSIPVAGAAGSDEVWISAAGRTDGASGSFWVTDLYVANLGDEAVDVEMTFLERGVDNTNAESISVTFEAGASISFDDVVLTVFGLEEATGAIRLAAADPGPDVKLVASARVYNLEEGATYGQGIEGIDARSSISATGAPVTHVIGVGENDGFRTNWFGLNLSEDIEGNPVEATVMVAMLDDDGDVIASKQYTMPPLAPVLFPISDVGGGTFEAAALRFTMIDGTAAFGASKIDQISNDPTTLASHVDPDACMGAPGEPVEIEEARLYVEYNATDGDLGVHGNVDHGGWTQICIFDPEGNQIASLRPKGETADLGFAELFFESEEPELDEFSFEDLYEGFPEGEYQVRGVTIDGERLEGAALFTHDIPAMPMITSPVGLVDDPEEEEPPVVSMQNFVVTWMPVVTTFDGEPVEITGYQVIITDDDAEDPNGFARPVYSVHVGPDQTSLPVPMEFFTADTLYEIEVIAIEVSGNQTIGLGFFETP